MNQSVSQSVSQGYIISKQGHPLSYSSRDKSTATVHTQFATGALGTKMGNSRLADDEPLFARFPWDKKDSDTDVVAAKTNES